ncbi:Hsp20/alpha crystallin family protein [Seonamhaeicola sp. ML3]|uniref:Hsp20/alpha crystallin family protein n=1 Tax=Seonamhaeicola sp. ML3 TaxID=2937786 RepID=UPI00200D5B4C|nr:Hsp20/alpha crystallin family protein [Seonamhaeicola sp. ML3]
MSNLVTTSRNGSLTNKNKMSNSPIFSSLDDWFFKDFPSFSPSNFSKGALLPQVNIRETPDAYFLDMAIPGMQKSDFTIDLDNDVLSISAETKQENEHVEETYTRKEFGYSSFKRTFTLPDTVESDKIKATYKEGILGIEIPKREEAKQKPPRTIKIS